MARTFQPLSNRVLVKPLKHEEVTRSGLIVPDTAKEKPQEGTVLAVGPGKLGEDGKRQPMEVKVGDLILYAKYGGTEVKGDIGREDEELMVLREEDILAIIRDGR